MNEKNLPYSSRMFLAISHFHNHYCIVTIFAFIHHYSLYTFIEFIDCCVKIIELDKEEEKIDRDLQNSDLNLFFCFRIANFLLRIHVLTLPKYLRYPLTLS